MAKVEIETIKAKDIFETTVDRMKSLGIYREEFDGTIQIYAQLVEQYSILTDRFERGKYKIQSQSAQGGLKKAPIVATLESLRKDILSYSNVLCLNPKAFGEQGVKDAPKVSKLDAALGRLGLG